MISRLHSKVYVLTLLMAVSSVACVSAPPGATPVKPESFQETLKVCRFQQGGGLIMRRNALPPTHPRIASCLARHGWSPDAMPTQPVP